ncbi:hypothetical protein [Azospirillum thermophilum]|uniref:Uncharacterized protein n=1 Tax=Azospirillum thermophilum TaxID=2202148 RepID=A0A2S2CQG7_9PROT|nr:hypothetical protein [Azospirillum thermophilum]AWK86741.1 hypothetical protein DEW08_11265 [Azospirillum thermophilum]
MANVLHDPADDKPYETFRLGVFIPAVLASAILLLALPIGFIFHFQVILYAALLATAGEFVAIYRMTAGRLLE